MSDLSTRLALPFIAPAQAQKHVTHNEALERLDLLVQMRVTAFEATTPPEAPAPGALYALGEGAEGAWAGQDGRLAAFTGDSWVFLDPQAGWLAVAADGAALRIYRDGTWQTGPDRLDRLGLGAEADAANRLTVAGPATLLNHGGAGHRLKVNKAGAGETASVLFQSGFTGHAEMGLAGQNDFSIKVSPDGSSWAEALRFNALTGFLGGEAVQSGPEDTTPGRALLNEAHGLGSFTGGVLSQPDANDAFPCGFYGGGGSGASNFPGAAAFRPFLVLNRRSNSYNYMTARIFIDTDAVPVVRESIDSGATWSPDNRLWGTANTTVDGSGFLLEASPVLRVHAAHLEEPVKPVGAGLRHAGTGHYVLTGTPPLAATGWRVRCPQDENGAPVARVADLYRHDGALHLRVCDPAGMPSDIPAGHFIMLRFWDAATEDDTPPPITELTTAEVTAREAALRETAVKAACRRRILDVLPETAQINLAAAVAAGRLSDADLSVYQAGLAWVDDMRATCRTIITDPAAPRAGDAAWPTVPDGVAALAARV